MKHEVLEKFLADARRHLDLEKQEKQPALWEPSQSKPIYQFNCNPVQRAVHPPARK